ncbi:MAG TPA: PTS sugar transporter subunit IIA [Candidatus Hydrogenedentes bacterium]|nr:PTS sugar transporter subunit IIA [Candidatus Hydrogenedentota bacterium]
MLLCELLRPDLIKVGLEAETREEAIGELVDVLVQAHEIPYARRDEVLEAVLTRESAMGSGMEHGVAIPHAGTDLVEDILCALGTAPTGIPFESLDGAPARLVLLMITPKRNFAGRVGAMACVGRLLGGSALVCRLVDECDPRGIYELIKRAELGE